MTTTRRLFVLAAGVHLFTAMLIAAQTVSLQSLVTPSTVIQKDGHTVKFALHGFIEFDSLAESFPYIESQARRWNATDAERDARTRELARRAVESRVVSMTDERPLEILLTHTTEELKQALADVKEPVPTGYLDAFVAVRDKWVHALNCWSASPSIPGRVLSNWYPIEEGISLYGATYDSTEHFWQAVKYHPDVTVAQLNELLGVFQRRNWSDWIARLDHDRDIYVKNTYAVEFLRHNLAPSRLAWFHDELGKQALQGSEHAREAQQRGKMSFRFAAFEEKVLWGDLADLFHLVYLFSASDDPIRAVLSQRHFDGIYLGERKFGFVSEEFRALMLAIWKVKYLQMKRFREVIAAIPVEIRLEHFLNDGDSPDIPIPIYVGYLNQIRDMAIRSMNQP